MSSRHRGLALLARRARVLFALMVVAALCAAPETARADEQAAPAETATPTPSPTPKAKVKSGKTIDEMDLEELLDQEIRAGELGSFGQRLSEYNVHAELHGYVSAELKELRMPWSNDNRKQISTFDLHHQVLNVRVSMFDRIEAESQVEWEHIGKDFYVPLAQIDIKARDWLIVRSGYFVVPVGAFNEYQYPDILRKAGQQPLFSREIVPALWSEVGIQLRGKFGWREHGNINYAVFLSNGLEQASGEGGSIRNMRRNDRDKTHGNKAVGGRLGVAPMTGLDVGVSAYTGAYTTDGARRLTIWDADLTWSQGKLLVRVEGALARQEVTGGTLRKMGGYVFGAYRASSALEPFFWLETVDLDAGPLEKKWGPLFGTVIYPFPERAENLMIKVEAGSLRDAQTKKWGGQGLIQVALGF
jgi:hypothetical protein